MNCFFRTKRLCIRSHVLTVVRKMPRHWSLVIDLGAGKHDRGGEILCQKFHWGV